MSSTARTSAPKSLQQAIQQEAESLFTTLPPTLAAQCREEYRRGALEVINRRAGVKVLSKSPENEAGTNISELVATPKPKLLPAVRRSVESEDPMVRLVDPATAKSCLTALCFAFGHEVNKHRMNALYTILRASGWTVAELELATAFIPSDSELCKTISFERTIAPGVFAEAKKRPEVMRGRLHDYRAAVEMSQELNRPLSECFEAVSIDGGETPKWVMK